MSEVDVSRYGSQNLFELNAAPPKSVLLSKPCNKTATKMSTGGAERIEFVAKQRRLKPSGGKTGNMHVAVLF